MKRLVPKTISASPPPDDGDVCGSLIAQTTPAGKRGWFYEQWHSGNDSWRRFRVPATDCPRISKEFLAEQLRELGTDPLFAGIRTRLR